MKKIYALLITVMIAIFCLSTVTMGSTYGSDWTLWDQDDSDDYLMQAYGCFVVALARIMVASGIENPASFNPDTFRDWEYQNGFLDAEFNQKYSAQCPVVYASQKGKTISFVGNDVNSLWNYINSNYFVIVQYNSGTATGHWVLICNQRSQETGAFYCYQSDYPYSKGIQPLPATTVKQVFAWTCNDEVNISETQINLYTGDSHQLSASVVGNLGNTVTWESSNPKVASVSGNGLVEAKSAGKTNIIARYGSASVTCKIVVTNKVVPITISLTTPSKVKMNKGDHYQILVSTTGKGGSVIWTTSDKKVASVANNGVVTAKKVGTATVTAVYGKSPKRSVKTKITVVKPSLDISKTKVTLEVGKSVKLKATVTGAQSKKTWKSSNTGVATVSSGGKVTGVGPGTTTISVSANGITKKCKVTVKADDYSPVLEGSNIIWINNNYSIRYTTPEVGQPTIVTISYGDSLTKSITDILGMKGYPSWSSGDRIVCMGRYNGKYYFNMMHGISTCYGLFTYTLGDTELKCVQKDFNIEKINRDNLMENRYIFGVHYWPSDGSDGYGTADIYDLKTNKRVELGDIQDKTIINNKIYYLKREINKKGKIVLKVYKCKLNGKYKKLMTTFKTNIIFKESYGRGRLTSDSIVYTYLDYNSTIRENKTISKRYRK